MLIGYARVSTLDQTVSLLQDALQQSGCERIFTDTASGARADRPGLDEALDFVRPGDTLVVWKLDRLGRSLPHLLPPRYSRQLRGACWKIPPSQLESGRSRGGYGRKTPWPGLYHARSALTMAEGRHKALWWQARVLRQRCKHVDPEL